MTTRRTVRMVLLAMWIDPGRHWTRRDLTLALPSADPDGALRLLEADGYIQQAWMWLKSETPRTLRLWRTYRLTAAGRAAAARITTHRKVATDQ